jgi:type I restriction enzyme R subunit
LPIQTNRVAFFIDTRSRRKWNSFDHVLDPQEKYTIALGAEKKLKLEQLNRKFISEENCLRIAEELKKIRNTERK